MNRFYLIPPVTIDRGGTPSTSPKYLRSLGKPGYACQYSALRYGRDDLWLVRVMEISDGDGAALAAQPDVYAFPLDADLRNAISDKSRIDAYFEGFRIPTDWTTASTTYTQLLRALVNMALLLQRFYSVTGAELFKVTTVDGRFRDLQASHQEAIRQIVNEEAGQNVPINQNNTLRQLLKAGSDLFQKRPAKLGDIVL
jgi:hypothetical protein